MSEIIAYLTIASEQGDQTDRIPITAEQWEDPLRRSQIWIKIEEAIDYARTYRTPDQRWIDSLRKQIQGDE